jgi:nitrite reductase/ring-hydroxylating ferredoxin subunit/uncharacterized membrane protein
VRNLLARWTRSIETDERLDRVADPAATLVQRVVPPGVVKDALSGVWLGHPLHPMLTDLPIGFWTSAMAVDVFDGKAGRDSARRLVGLGLLSAVPTAAAGASDWGDTTSDTRRVGLVHAVSNSTALALYFGSWRARRRGRHGWGVVLSFAGATAATVGGYLGGHLLENRGVGVDHTAFSTGPADWARVMDVDAVTNEPARVEAAETPVIVCRHRGGLVALGAVCPHRGAPMEDAAIESDTITCPWHGSRFALPDGELLRGPATVRLPRYEARVRDGGVEVRRPQT